MEQVCRAKLFPPWNVNYCCWLWNREYFKFRLFALCCLQNGNDTMGSFYSKIKFEGINICRVVQTYI